MAFTVTLNRFGVTGPINVDYSTADAASSTATAGSDYTAKTGTLMIPAGESTGTILIPILGDSSAETDEQFLVNLANATAGATIIDGQATGTIVDDEGPVISISDASLTEGDAGSANMIFVVTLTGTVSSDVTLNYSTVDGTATSGITAGDYNTTTGSLTFTSSGPKQKTIAVPIRGDLLREDTQQFFVQLTSITGGSLANTQATGTIFDNNDPVPAMSVSGGNVVEGPAGANAVYTISLSNGSDTPITVDFATQNGAGQGGATAGADFTAVAGKITFVPGQTVQTISVPIVDDSIIEGNETFTGTISNAQGATISTASATSTIIDNDIVATIDSVTLAEGNSGTTAGSLTVTLSGAPVTGAPVTVNFAVASGTATSGSDFAIVTQSPITFDPGQTTKQIAFNIVGDTRNEANETFTVTLTGATNGVVGANATGTVTITNDDAAPVISIANASVAEGDNVVFTVSLDAPSDQQITVKAGTTDGTASSASAADFTGIANQTITFAPGETSKTFTVATTEDNVEELDETFTVTLSEPTVGTLGTATATGTITNDDLRTLSIADVSIAEGNSGTKEMVFTVTLASAALQEVTVSFTTVDGTAKAGTDYVATNGTLTFAPGELTKTIAVTLNGDTTPEGDELFKIVLSNAQNAVVADGEAQGRIIDDETQYTLSSVSNGTAAEDNSTGTIGNTITFQVTRSGDLTNTGTVDFKTIDGTMTGGAVSTGARADFVASAGTLTFAPGQSTKTVTVQLRPDLNYEADETFTLQLTGSSNGSLVDGTGAPQATLSATGTITNNDVRPTVSIDDASVFEGNPDGNSANDPDTTDMVFTVRLSAANETEAVTVDYTALQGANDTALNAASGAFGQDFFIASGTTQTVTFAPGETAKTFVVKVVRDARDEADTETFSAKISNAAAGTTALTIADDTAKGTIRDDDATPTLKFDGANNGDILVVEGTNPGGQTSAAFTLKLSAPSERPITVNFSALDGTAKLGEDFTQADSSTQVTFAAGETTKQIQYFVLADAKKEVNETATIALSQPANVLLADSEATLTITDDDAPPALTINDVTVVEGNSGTSQLVFTVSLSAPHDDVVTVDFASVNGTGASGAISGAAGADFDAVKGRLSFAANELSKTISVPIFGDTFKENDETFTVALTNAVNATIARASGTGTIAQDGDAGIGISIADIATEESNTGTHTVTFTVQLSAAAAENVTFTAATRDGTATSGVDYGGVNQSFTIPAGSTSTSVNVVIGGDGRFEPTESFFVTLSNVSSNAAVVDGEGRGTIYNDDIKIVDKQTIKYIDEDGDLVTVSISKGALARGTLGTLALDTSVVSFRDVGNFGGKTLEFLDFTRRPLSFTGTDLRITADPQPGFRAGGGTSDGQVDVGFIRGAIVESDILLFTKGIDFNNVYIEGDVAKFVAGDVQITPAIAGTFHVGSLGVRADTLPNGVTDNLSSFLSKVNAMNIDGDVTGTIQIVGGDLGDLNSLRIGGALRGGSGFGSGQVFFTGTLGQATVGEIIGGSGDNTGIISGSFNVGTAFRAANIGSVTVLHGITGGAGQNSGKILAPSIGSVTIGKAAAPAGITGGAGQESGSILGDNRLGKVVINGDIAGGSGQNSGGVFSNGSIVSALVRGSIVGGTGQGSGRLLTAANATDITVLENIQGGGGQGSGSIQVNRSLTTLIIGDGDSSGGGALDNGNLLGGAGVSSGVVSVGGKLGAATIHGSIKGGSANNSGGVDVDGEITALDVGGNLEGGSSTAGNTATLTGYVTAGRIAQMTVGGDIKVGTNGGAGLFDSGVIRVDRDLQFLLVRGNVFGDSTTPVVIAAAGSGNPPPDGNGDLAIQRLVVNGDVSFLNVLGGYGANASSTAPLGTPTNPDAQIGSVVIRGDVVATDIVAGVARGADGRFGTADDALISGGLADDPTVVATIAKIVLEGDIQTNADAYGIVAQEIKSVLLGPAGTPLDLTPGKGNDNEAIVAGSNFIVREIPV
jgi:hypothetical protein